MSSLADFLGSDKGMSVISQAGDALSAILPQQRVNQDFLNRNTNVMNRINRANSVSNAVSGALISSGNPIAMGAGLLQKAGSAVVGASQDEYGVINNKFLAGLGAFMNPIEGISAIAGQKDAETAKERHVNTELAQDISDTKAAGNQLQNALPRYSPPSYGGTTMGKNGMKFKPKSHYNAQG